MHIKSLIHAFQIVSNNAKYTVFVVKEFKNHSCGLLKGESTIKIPLIVRESTIQHVKNVIKAFVTVEGAVLS